MTSLFVNVDCEVHQPHRRCPVRVSHSTWLFPVCLKCRLYHQHKHVLARKLQSCWKQWCQSHHGNCSYKWCLFFHSPLLPLSMWHPSVISFCHNALGINVPMPRTQKGKTLTFCSAPNARREQGQEVCLWALSGVGGVVLMALWNRLCERSLCHSLMYTIQMPFLAFWNSCCVIRFNSTPVEEQWRIKSQNWKFCHLLTLVSFQTRITVFLL